MRAPVWGANPFLQIIAEVATTTSYCYAQRGLATSWFGGDSVANDRGSSTSVSPLYYYLVAALRFSFDTIVVANKLLQQLQYTIVM